MKNIPVQAWFSYSTIKSNNSKIVILNVLTLTKLPLSQETERTRALRKATIYAKTLTKDMCFAGLPSYLETCSGTSFEN